MALVEGRAPAVVLASEQLARHLSQSVSMVEEQAVDHVDHHRYHQYSADSDLHSGQVEVVAALSLSSLLLRPP